MSRDPTLTQEPTHSILSLIEDGGMKHTNTLISAKWTSLEPMINTRQYPQDVHGLVLNILPCEVREICTFVIGLNAGYHLKVTEKLEQIEKDLSDTSLNVEAKKVMDHHAQHLAQTANLAKQITSVSANLAGNIKSLEVMMTKFSDQLMRTPITSVLPDTAALVKSIESSVFWASKKPEYI